MYHFANFGHVIVTTGWLLNILEGYIILAICGGHDVLNNTLFSWVRYFAFDVSWSVSSTQMFVEIAFLSNA